MPDPTTPTTPKVTWDSCAHCGKVLPDGATKPVCDSLHCMAELQDRFGKSMTPDLAHARKIRLGHKVDGQAAELQAHFVKG